MPAAIGVRIIASNRNPSVALNEMNSNNSCVARWAKGQLVHSRPKILS
jgi:hypothetical protein